MVENAPPPVDLQEFQFKLHSKLKIFENTDDSKFKNAYNLVAAASKYGLVFVGSPNATLEVIQLKSIESSSITKVESSSFPKRSVLLPAVPSHVTVNCDQTLLAVICYKNDCATAIVYSTASFLAQNVVMSREIRISATPGVAVLEAGWNPTVPGALTACKADGSLGVYNINENSVDINELPVAAAARCFCWSPKGKQLVVGSTNGSLTQYKPDLKAVKVIPAPGLSGAGPHCVLSVCWLSNYQFVTVYRDMGVQQARYAIVIVNALKTGPTTYVNYDDICYSFGKLRPPQYYIIHQPTWGVMIVTSANSMEVGVLGINGPGEPSLWVQWNQIDAARAELPLSAAHQETFPVGVALDTGVSMQLPWGDNQTLPPMPFIHLLSHHGVLCSFSVINIRQGAQTVCAPPEAVKDQSGLGLFRQAAPIPTPAPAAAPAAVAPQQPAPVPAPVQQVAPARQVIPQPVTTAAVQSTFGGLAFSTPAFGGLASSLSLSAAPNFAAPASSAAPTFGNLASSPAPAFSSLTVKPQPAFGAPASIAATASIPVANTAATAPSSVAPPVGSLLGWTAGSTLFAPGTAPNFASIAATSQPTASTSASAFTTTIKAIPTATPAATGSGSFLGGIPVASSAPIPTTSMFGGLTSSPVAAIAPKPSTSMFGLSAHSAPNVTALNMTIAKPSTPNVASVAPIGSTPTNVMTPVLQGTAMMYMPPISKPLLSTPKPQPKPDILNTSQPLNQTLTPNNETLTSKKDETVISDKMIESLIKEEVKNFQAELQELFHRCKNINLDVGTEEEKTNLVLMTSSLLEFHKELQDTTESQIAEVHYLKQALLQSFAWYEDTKARHRRYTDPDFASLLQAQELDPVSEKQLADIKHRIYYIEAQLKEVDSFLDNQWADFQDSCKKHVKGRLQIPTLEPIYQTLIRQNAILDKQRYLLKDIAARIKSRNKKAASYPQVMNLTHLVNNKDHTNIHEELQKLKLDHNDLFTARYDTIFAKEKKFTDYKQSKLCSFFTNRNVIHVKPKKPKFVNSLLNTPSKFNSFMTSPNVQRNLAQSFDKVDSPFNNSSAEANMSASNLFSFNLLDGAHNTRTRSPEKPATGLMFNSPKPAELQIKQVVSVSSAPISTKISTNLFNLSSTSPAASSGPVFNFTASSTATTHSKPVIFDSGDTSSQTLMFSGPSNNAKPALPVTKFGLSPQTTFTQFKSDVKPAEVPSKEITVIFAGLAAATTEAKPAQPQHSFSFIAPQAKPAITVPSSATKPTALSANLFAESSSSAATSKSSSTTMFADSSNVIAPKATAAVLAGLRDSIEPGFNFGSALSLGQQSTPKPKPSNTINTTNLGQILTQVSTTATASVGKPITAVVTSAITSISTPTQIVIPKPTFALAQPPVATTSTPVGQVSTPAVKLVPVKSEAVATPAPTTTPSIFGGLASNNKIMTPGSFFGQQASTPVISATTGNIFGSIQSTPVAVSDSLLVAKSAQQPEKPATSIAVGNASTPTTATTGFSFTQAAAGGEPAKSPLFSGVAAATHASSFFGAAVTTIVTTTTTSSTASSFSFLQPVASTVNISAAATPAAATAAAIPKITSVFSLTTAETKPAETATGTVATTTTIAAAFGDTNTTSSFSFGALAEAVTATTTDNNKFSFGNLTVSALSPTTPAATPTTTTADATGFSFALAAAATNTTNETSPSSAGFGGFSSSPFSKPVAAVTTSVSSFVGQPICSPSSFTQPQNSGSAFGQSTGNIFAQKSSTPVASSTSIFAQQSSGGSLFGQAASIPAVTSTTSIFGQSQSPQFGSTSPSATSSTGSIFGQNPTFGTSTPTTASSSIFGQNTFGGPVATSSSGNFSFTQNTQSTFGTSGGSIFAAKPAFASTPAFGQPPAFGAPPSFGGAPADGNVFGGPIAASNTGGSSFTSGFGTPSTFGQKPAFGSPPSFGQNAFGSTPSFGAAPAFGGPQRVFGATSSPPAGTFGSAVQENSTFANLANQPTLGFGNLVQNEPAPQQQQPPQFPGGAQFSSWR